jgi:hypothetical protein
LHYKDECSFKRGLLKEKKKMSVLTGENASSERSASVVFLSLYETTSVLQFDYIFTHNGEFLILGAWYVFKIWAFKPLPRIVGLRRIRL